ncbi:mitogen-activated protein kinase kinase kinase 18 [Brassica napus]|uniref:mitogen-activated protein kinase kinase kinase 18 n=1 Tax=Brassica napus TaxID=3708 RepID=UPI00207874AF|nr:mitogen-activated protein kinase kinase kinase 18 [Brassica napus]
MNIAWTRGPTIGRGSTATVSIATSNTGEIFAVKSANFSSSAFLQREQSILSTLSSPHIVKYIGSSLTCENDRLVYNILMEYVSGGSLHGLIKNSGGKLPEPAIRSHTRQILKGLKYLHERGIVHCDLKSQNVLVGENGVVSKIADLGCAKPVFNSGFSGTPAFMAPEVARGEEQRFPADVWALGCTVIEMMTGSSPWPELNDAVAGMYKIGYSGESPEIPEGTSEKGRDFVMRCLRVDPKQRWTVEELLKHPFLDDDEEDEESQSIDYLRNTSSPSTVLDQRFWNSCEDSETEDPFADYSDSWRSPADRIEQLAGDEVTSVPSWDTVDDGEWIQVRGDVIGEAEKRVSYGGEDIICVEATSSSQVIEDWIWDQESLLSEYSSDDVIASLYSNAAIQGNLIVYNLGDKNVPINKMFRNYNEDKKTFICQIALNNVLTKTNQTNMDLRSMFLLTFVIVIVSVSFWVKIQLYKRD